MVSVHFCTEKKKKKVMFQVRLSQGSPPSRAEAALAQAWSRIPQGFPLRPGVSPLSLQGTHKI